MTFYSLQGKLRKQESKDDQQQRIVRAVITTFTGSNIRKMVIELMNEKLGEGVRVNV